jgi:hypothetical protein
MGILNSITTGRAAVLSEKPFSDYVNTNTLFIAVIVLAVIVLIMLITYFASIRPNLNNSPAEQPSRSDSPVDNVLTQITRSEEEELVSDCELVAVITAAIYASMGDTVPADGLVVRSIRRVSGRKWMNA